MAAARGEAGEGRPTGVGEGRLGRRLRLRWMAAQAAGLRSGAEESGRRWLGRGWQLEEEAREQAEEENERRLSVWGGKKKKERRLAEEGRAGGVRLGLDDRHLAERVGATGGPGRRAGG